MVDAGKRCQRFLEATITRIPVEDIQADEVWAFVSCKEKTRIANNRSGLCGDAYTFTAIERNTELIVAWHLGKRCPEDTMEFAEKLRRATTGRFQLTTDGYTPYRTAIPFVFGPTIDFAQLVKEYGDSEEGARRYSPAEVIGITIHIRTGAPKRRKSARRMSSGTTSRFGCRPGGLRA